MSGGHYRPEFLQGFWYHLPQPPPREIVVLCSGHVVRVACDQLAGRWHPEGVGKPLHSEIVKILISLCYLPVASPARIKVVSDKSVLSI